MEILIGLAVVTILLVAAIFIATWKIVGAAVENVLDWLIYTFGNDRAVEQLEEKWRQRDRDSPT